MSKMSGIDEQSNGSSTINYPYRRCTVVFHPELSGYFSRFSAPLAICPGFHSAIFFVSISNSFQTNFFFIRICTIISLIVLRVRAIDFQEYVLFPVSICGGIKVLYPVREKFAI